MHHPSAPPGGFARRQRAAATPAKSSDKHWQRLLYKPKVERLEDRTQPAALSPFDPAFASLVGTFNPGVLGRYTVDESGPNPVIRNPSNVVIATGVYFNNDAVFDFNSFTLMN